MEERKPNETSPLLERFLRYKLVIQGRSKATVSEYHLDLYLFFRFIIARRSGIPTDSEEFEKIDISCVDEEFSRNIKTMDILEFMAYLASERGCGASARSRKLSAIKAYFKYLTAVERVMEKNPAVDIESPKIKKALPKFLSLDESLALLNSVYEDENSKTKERDYCILTLFLNCGMRLSELVGINLTDIDPQMRSLRVVGKGNKERVIVASNEVMGIINKYINMRGITMKDKDEYLLVSHANRKSGSGKVSTNMIYRIVKHYAELADIDPDTISPHTLRHTFATQCIGMGTPIQDVQQLMGHASINTTELYNHSFNIINNNPAEKLTSMYND